MDWSCRAGPAHHRARQTREVDILSHYSSPTVSSDDQSLRTSTTFRQMVPAKRWMTMMTTNLAVFLKNSEKFSGLAISYMWSLWFMGDRGNILEWKELCDALFGWVDFIIVMKAQILFGDGCLRNESFSPAFPDPPSLSSFFWAFASCFMLFWCDFKWNAFTSKTVELGTKCNFS